MEKLRKRPLISEELFWKGCKNGFNKLVDNDVDNISADHHYEVNDSEAIGKCLRRRQKTSGCDQTGWIRFCR